jgi:hypothetical protein
MNSHKSCAVSKRANAVSKRADGCLTNVWNVSIAGTLTPGELRFLGFKVIGKLFEYTETDEDDTKRHLAEPFVSQLDRDDFPEYYEIIKGVLRGVSSNWAMSTQPRCY